MMAHGDGWHSAHNIKVACEGIREVSGKWTELSGRMDTVAKATAPLSLLPTAFAVPDPIVGASGVANDLNTVYGRAHDLLVKLFTEATQEFDHFAKALLKCADEYEHTDVANANDFDTIARS